MKILHVISFGYEGGGAENEVLLLKQTMEQNGHEVKVLSSDIGRDRPDFFADHTFKRILNSGVSRYFYHVFNPHSYLALRRLRRDFQPDIVHLHTMGQPSPSILYLLRRTPTILTVHGPEEFTRWLLPWCLPSTDYRGDDHDLRELRLVGKLHYFYHRRISDPIYRLGLRNVDIVVAVSEYIRRMLAVEGIKSIAIPNGITLFPYSESRAGHRLLCVGRLEKYKGLEHVIRALPAILKRYPDTHLEVVGEGPDEERLRGITTELGIQDSVSFTGNLPHVKLLEHYQAASLFVMPAVMPEAFGKVGVEAMSTGTPVIASNIGGITDWLQTGRNGRLTSPGDTSQIADGIIELFSDSALLRQMGKTARTTAERYNVDRHTTDIEQLYRHLLETKK